MRERGKERGQRGTQSGNDSPSRLIFALDLLVVRPLDFDEKEVRASSNFPELGRGAMNLRKEMRSETRLVCLNQSRRASNRLSLLPSPLARPFSSSHFLQQPPRRFSLLYWNFSALP